MNHRTYGQYELRELIGSGGMGQVYKALDTTLQREVAVKVLSSRVVGDATTLERFRSEAITLGRLSHPNIASVYSFLESNGEYLLVMELVTGETLEDLVKREGPLPPQKASELIGQALQGLEHAHSKNVIHRDIKPSNLMVTEDGAVKLMDFGIAKVAEGPKLTREGKAPGTPEYMSPEQIQGLALDPRSDLYSMGVVLYEMLTGDVPFHGDTDFELMRAHIDVQAPSIKALSTAGVEIDRIIQRSLAKNPANRYSTAGQMKADLAKVAAASSDASVGSNVRATAWRYLWLARNSPRVAIGMMVLMAIPILLALFVPSLRVEGGALAVLVSALVLALCNKAHYLAIPVGGTGVACGLAILGLALVSPSVAAKSTPTLNPPALVHNNVIASPPPPDNSGSSSVADQIDLDKKKDELEHRRMILDQRQMDQENQAAKVTLEKLVSDVVSASTTANDEHDQFAFSHSQAEQDKHRSAALVAAKEALDDANKALTQSAQPGLQISGDEKGKLLYDVALMHWMSDQSYKDDLSKIQDAVPLMSDTKKQADVKSGLQFLKDRLNKNQPAWPKKGFHMQTFLYSRQEVLA